MAIPNHPKTPRQPRWLGGKSGARIFNFVLIPLLVIVALVLPPISIPERIMDAGMARIPAEGGVVSDPDGTAITFQPQNGQGSFRAKLSSVPRVAFLEGSAGKDLLAAAKAIPTQLVAKSPFYQLTTRGQAVGDSTWTVPIPNDSEPYETLDVYTWDSSAKSWEWLPHTIIYDDDQVESALKFVPSSVMVMQTNPMPAVISLDLAQADSLPKEGQGALAQVHPIGLTLGDKGNLEGSIDPGFDKLAGGLPVVPVIRNYEGPSVRSDLLANMLDDPEQRKAHIQAIVNLVVGNLYGGVELDYRGLDNSVRAQFNQFVSDLAQELHAQNKTLAVRVEAPSQVSEDSWDTGAYDWQTLGVFADVLKVPAPVDPRAYVSGGQIDALLKFAVGQVNRYKLSLVLAGQSVEQAGNYMLLRSYKDALEPLVGRIQADQTVVEPGKPLNLALVSTHPNSGLVYDPNIGTYVYRYQDDQGNARTVWLENAASLSHKLDLIKSFGIHGFMLENMPADGQDADLWTLMRDYQQGSAKPLESNLTVEWSVKGQTGQEVSQVRPLSDPKAAVAAPSDPGALEIKAAIVDRGQVLNQQTISDVAVATYTPVATATPVATPTPTGPAYAQLAAKDGTINVRSGPSTGYPKVGEINQGETYKITGKSDDGKWYQIQFNDDTMAWVSVDLVLAAGPLDGVQVAKAEALPTPAPQAAQPAAASSGSTTAAKPAAAVPASAGAFGYGIQVAPYDLAGVANKTRAMGFGWVKVQVPWKDLEGTQGSIGWGGLDEMVNTFSGAGLKFLVSIPKAPTWARPSGTDMSVEGPPADPGTYANFVGQLASRYCGKINAIEVWNEQNLWYEWGHQNLNAGDYMKLLSAAYGAIKGACPQTVVVSGALTPTGAPAPLAVDDFTYLEQMYQNGLKNVSDAIGAHPSGFNVAPDVDGGSAACDFISQQGSSYKGPCNSPHHSWSFKATMEGYRNIMVKYGDSGKRIWPTEFGWATGWTGQSGYEYANDNTPEEQAQWTVKAYQMMKSWGFVGTAFLWNLNYGVTNPGTELAQWGIIGRPAYDALAQMAK